jgi:predicted secreted protein
VTLIGAAGAGLLFPAGAATGSDFVVALWAARWPWIIMALRGALDKEDHMADENISVPVGREFAVRLQSTPATAYAWEVQLLPEQVEFLGSDYEKPEGEVRPGSQVGQVFRFRARRAGEHTITLGLKRQWESSAASSHTVKVNAA